MPRRPAQGVGELEVVGHAALREVARAAEAENRARRAADLRRQRLRVVLGEVEVAADVGGAKLVDEVRAEDVRLAERQVLVEERLRAGEEGAEGQVADHVRVLRLVRDVANREVVVLAEPVIDAGDEGLSVVWLADAEVGRADLNRNAVDCRCSGRW